MAADARARGRAGGSLDRHGLARAEGSARVLPATRTLVEEAVAQLGYVPTGGAQPRHRPDEHDRAGGLRAGEPLFSDPFFASVVHGISSAIADGDLQHTDPQDWCNPPGGGVGARPTTDTGSPLGDALLWVKVPGESDGTCTRGAPAGSPDPEWGVVDPAAGQWFPQQALQLAQLANPPLLRR